jgi:hypothetical protein
MSAARDTLRPVLSALSTSASALAAVTAFSHRDARRQRSNVCQQLEHVARIGAVVHVRRDFHGRHQTFQVCTQLRFHLRL